RAERLHPRGRRHEQRHPPRLRCGARRSGLLKERYAMTTQDNYQPRPEHKFTFGLWTVGNRGRDPFGDAVRPPLPPVEAARLLGEVGAWGVNFHDNDLVPINATPAAREQIVREFKTAC